MSSLGRVIGGAYLDAAVTTATFGSDLVVQTGIKGRKLTVESVAAWQEISIEARGSTLTAIGKAAAGVALPGRFGRAASAAVVAALDSKRPDRHLRIDWADGKQSLLKLPAALFTHLELILSSRRILEETAPQASVSSHAEVQPSVADRTFDLVAGLVVDRFPPKIRAPQEVASIPAAQIDVADQLHKLSSLRDAGVLTDQEFAAKKAELLARL
jgi:hypothetical protein